MTGSLQPKNNIWYMVINEYVNGKRKQKWVSTKLSINGNKRKAQQMLNEYLSSHSNDSNTDSSILFSDYIRIWLEKEKTKVDVVTYQGYELITLNHVLPYFDNNHILLCDVTRSVLQEFIDLKVAFVRPDGKGHYSPNTIKQFKNIISQALNDAVKCDYIGSNPCSLVEIPKRNKYRSNYYTIEQITKLFSCIKGDELENLIKITFLYGLRRSEVLGIKWSSIDFDNKRLTIQNTVCKVTEVVEKEKTKNQSSFRSFTLADSTLEIFKELLNKENANRLLFGDEYQENDYVFKWANGKPYSPDYVSKHFSLLLEQKGLPHIRFHELRHSCASYFLANGYSLKDVQEYMGHSDIRMTADIYGHLDIDRKKILTNSITDRLLA